MNSVRISRRYVVISDELSGCQMNNVKHIIVLAWATIFLVFLLGFSVPVPQTQVPYPAQGQRPMGQSQAGPRQGLPQVDMPQEYAFRPDLSNPEFGNCLQLEKNWKALWERYTNYYEQVRMMHPGSPQFGQATRILQHMKMELDAAWNAFQGQCIYFPRR
ncbi:MAG: hypothetical protein QG577_143 [Thermodesulfobacteriota bacterium]|nr:hypothetical protein [Thermodesulfobacteriota bacterium]